MVGVCRALLGSGSCSDDHCRFHHDIHICETCSVVCITGNSYQAHLGGKNHQKTLERVARAQTHGIDTEFCELCCIPIINHNWERHQRTKRHLNKQRFFAFKSLLEEAEKDKHGISVSSSDGVDFGIIYQYYMYMIDATLWGLELSVLLKTNPRVRLSEKKRTSIGTS